MSYVVQKAIEVVIVTPPGLLNHIGHRAHRVHIGEFASQVSIRIHIVVSRGRNYLKGRLHNMLSLYARLCNENIAAVRKSPEFVRTQILCCRRD